MEQEGLQRVSFQHLEGSDLSVDALYEGGRSGNAGDDPLTRLIGVSNQGGFRYLGRKESPRLIVLTSTFGDPDWPDSVDPETGILTYYGDNKRPGRALHETPRHGNLLLRNLFHALHAAARHGIPPILVFGNAGSFRDVRFLGLAVPGTAQLNAMEDLVAIWKIAKGQRFQNYRASLTILDVPLVSRAWLDDLKSGSPSTVNAPPAWRRWVEGGPYEPLIAERAVDHRSRAEQIPQSQPGLGVVRAIHSHFRDWPVGFEACACRIAQLMDTHFVSFDLTRPSRDGGRDAIGLYRVGTGASAMLVDFALEAKCFDLENSVGVKETSRLISRLRHRQFGVLVTTSYLNLQAYQELKEDRHPVIVIAAADIVGILARAGLNTPAEVASWINAEFPNSSRAS